MRRSRRRAAARQLVLYDAVCGLCDRSVQFLLAADRRRALTFAPLQGETAAAIRRRQPALAGIDSMVYVRDEGTAAERVFVRSRAVVEVLAALGGFWRVVAWPLRAVPPPLRDAAYDQVARHRYGWFGKLDTCRLPAAGDEERFVA